MPTILNVNDQAAAAYVICRQLRAAGFHVLEAPDGKTAIEIARREQPALIVLDVQLPDMDGFEVCRRLRADTRTSGIAILHTSATHTNHTMRVAGLEGGADGYLTQPFDGDELVATVRALLRIKTAEDEQRRRAEALAHADRRKDEFLAMLAHELRNPLAAIAHAGNLLRAGTGPDIAARAGAVVRRQVVHLTSLVDDLLDIARMVRGSITLQRRTLDLAQVVRETATMLEASKLAQRGQRLQLVLAPGPWAVDGDSVRIEQVVTNLLDNASKFSADGGVVELTLARDERRGEAVLTVRDRGVGIEPEKLAHVFEAFYQADPGIDRTRGGLGIGLALAQRLVELHGGSIRIDSDGVGHGTAVEIRLPLSSAIGAPGVAPATNGSGSGSGNGAASQRRARVLIVEDNDDARELTAEVLRLHGHDVVVAADGRTGLDLALAELPDVAFIDVGLPGLDGLEVARQIRARAGSQQIALIAVSGYGSDEHRIATMAAGFDAHLVKPADPLTLAQLAERHGKPIGRADGDVDGVPDPVRG